MDERAISFGPFFLAPARRLLLEDRRPVRLGSRAFDLLTALVERAGELVGKDELIARVWPNLFVEESNLKMQVSALRRALGDGQAGNRYIATVPARGYEFVAPLSVTEEPRLPPSPTVAAPELHNLPVAVTRMIGREETVTALVSRLSRERLLTLLSPGGIGKTTVALAVAEAVVSGYEDGVWLVDLAPLGDARLVSSAIATILDLQIHAEDPLPGLIARLRDKRMLLVLDNCEHVIEAVASLAEMMLRGAAGITILATSRSRWGLKANASTACGRWPVRRHRRLGSRRPMRWRSRPYSSSRNVPARSWRTSY
jgi:DNA-binding winged helix-turn-helix (wHTH) protein